MWEGEDAESQVDEDATLAHEGQRAHRLLHRDLYRTEHTFNSIVAIDNRN